MVITEKIIVKNKKWTYKGDDHHWRKNEKDKIMLYIMMKKEHWKLTNKLQTPIQAES
jgi:hypothetical protein